MANKSNPHHQGEVLKPFSPTRLVDGTEEMIMHPNELNIVWGKDERYWKVPEGEGPAELYQVSWLEVTGSVSNIKADKEYEVGFKLKFTPDAFGWGSSPIYIMVKRGKKGKFTWRKEPLDSNKTDEFKFATSLSKAETSAEDSDSRKLYFGMYEVWSGKWKGGLWITHAFVREKP